MAKVPTALGWFREGVNWLVVLSSSAMVFGVGFYKDFASADPYVRGFFLFSLFCFFLTIVAGVMCYFYVNEFANHFENRDLFTQRLQAAQTDENRAGLERAKLGMKNASTWYSRLYYLVMTSFATGMGALLVLTVLALTFPESPMRTSQTNSDKQSSFALTSTVRHATGQTVHTHAFLLNQSTGETWEMVCKGMDHVEFRKVPVEGLPKPTH